MLKVGLINGTKRFNAIGLLDTGADITLINKQIRKHFGIDFQLCKNGQTIGIFGGAQKTWIADIEIEVENLLNSKRTVQVEFIDSPNVGILLGHKGFFENFSVKFDTYMLTFEIENKP